MRSPRFPVSATALLAGALIASAPAINGAQQAPATFRAGVEAVAVDAFVTDRQGNPVRNLTVADFDILEDGKPQSITSFTEVNIPIVPPEPYSATAVQPDVATNTGGEGRLYVVVFDELHPSPSISVEGLALKARQFLHGFIEQHFEANDVGIVVSIGHTKAGWMQDFTSNRRLLLNAIDTYSGGLSDMEPASLRARNQARALRDLMESLERIQGRRKAVIYIASEVGESAITTPPTSRLEPIGDSRELDVANSTAGRANVWDVIDYTGGVKSIAFDDLRAAMAAAMRGGIAFYTFDPAGADPEMVGTSENLERMGGLRKLASVTGGFAVVNSNQFTQAFPRLVAENSNYYVLGYTSSNDKRDGRYRRLQVRMKRPDLNVRFRDGYIGPSKLTDRPEPKPQTGLTLSAGVGTSIRTPLSNDTVPMSVFAAAYRANGKDANVVIVVEMDANRLGFVEGSTTGGDVEVAAVAVSAGGNITRGQHERFGLALRLDTWSKVRESGVRIRTGLTLPPGRYQLRVAGGNVSAPRAGSVMYDLDVPDFSKPALAISAMSLTSRHGEATLAVQSKSVKAAIPLTPVATRDFAAGDMLSVYAEIYDNKAKESHRLELAAELRHADGHLIGRPVTDSRADGKPVQAFGATWPLDVPAGRYVLHVEARSSDPKQGSVMREIPLRVR